MVSRPDAAARAIQCLLEGRSIHSTERLSGLNRNTIMRLLLVAGECRAKLMDARMMNLRPRYLQIDEIWTFVAKKARNVRKDDAPEVGDQWVFVAMDAESKVVPTYLVGGHLKAALALYFAYYNFCRIHSTLRVTPAMESGVTDHVWSVAELLQNA
jgi:hypothetical protein